MRAVSDLCGNVGKHQSPSVFDNTTCSGGSKFFCMPQYNADHASVGDSGCIYCKGAKLSCSISYTVDYAYNYDNDADMQRQYTFEKKNAL